MFQDLAYRTVLTADNAGIFARWGEKIGEMPTKKGFIPRRVYVQRR